MLSTKGSITVIDYNEETGVLSFDADAEAIQLLCQVGINKLLEDYLKECLDEQDKT